MPRILAHDVAPVPSSRSLAVVRRAAAECTACPLHARATQTVFGAGASHPALMLVGEQPGDREDLEGVPFVGPAGRILDRALERAGVDRARVYTTNAVKHFKWRPTSGKRRLHDRPDRSEIEACKPWLHKEIQLLAPDVIVALGVTAATSLLGKVVAIGKSRQRPFDRDGTPVLVTFHPSSVLQMRETEDREARLHELVEDLAHAWSLANGPAARASAGA
jgi:uracil-DNA glycosylase family protein